MPRYVALLRSVNIGGYGRIKMNDLRESFNALGYDDVLTYIQSGNVLFSTSSRSEKAIADAIEGQLAEDFGDAPAVLLRTVSELRRIGTASPYARAGADPARHHVTFLATAPSREVLKGLALPPSGNDELVVDGREVYVHTPNGYAETKYTGTFLERRLGVVSTTRELELGNQARRARRSLSTANGCDEVPQTRGLTTSQFPPTPIVLQCGRSEWRAARACPSRPRGGAEPTGSVRGQQGHTHRHRPPRLALPNRASDPDPGP